MLRYLHLHRIPIWYLHSCILRTDINQLIMQYRPQLLYCTMWAWPHIDNIAKDLEIMLSPPSQYQSLSRSEYLSHSFQTHQPLQHCPRGERHWHVMVDNFGIHKWQNIWLNTIYLLFFKFLFNHVFNNVLHNNCFIFVKIAMREKHLHNTSYIIGLHGVRERT